MKRSLLRNMIFLLLLLLRQRWLTRNEPGLIIVPSPPPPRPLGYFINNRLLLLMLLLLLSPRWLTSITAWCFVLFPRWLTLNKKIACLFKVESSWENMNKCVFLSLRWLKNNPVLLRPCLLGNIPSIFLLVESKMTHMKKKIVRPYWSERKYFADSEMGHLKKKKCLVWLKPSLSGIC